MNKLEEAAKTELISNYVQLRGNEWLYDQSAMLNMFRKGAQWQQANAWISVEDEMPPNKRDFIGYSEGEVEIYYLEIKSPLQLKRFVRKYQITHWMKLPEPPKPLVDYPFFNKSSNDE